MQGWRYGVGRKTNPEVAQLLALIIMGYSAGQWLGPVLAGRIFDATRSYDAAWAMMTLAGVLGAATIYAISPRSRVTPAKAGVHSGQGGFPPARE
jgi:cyanate permease